MPTKHLAPSKRRLDADRQLHASNTALCSDFSLLGLDDDVKDELVQAGVELAQENFAWKFQFET